MTGKVHFSIVSFISADHEVAIR